jgi:PAS domain S-box-containing protein
MMSANMAAARMLGYKTPEELLGIPSMELYVKADGRERLLAELMKRGHVQDYELTLKKRDGTPIDTLGSATIRRDRKGSIQQVEGIFADITERKRMEGELRKGESKLRLLLDSTGEAIYGTDLQGRCTFCNAACLRLLDYKHADELLGKNMHDLTHHTRPDGTPYPVEECKILHAIRKGEGTHVDDEVLWRSDGTSFPAEYRSFPQRSANTIVGAVVTFADITERKRMQDEIQRHSAHLEELVFERTKKLAESERKFREQRDRFIGILNAMADNACIISQHYQFEYTNPAFVNEFGEAGTQKCYEFFHGRHEVCPWCRNPEVFEGRTVRWEWYSERTQKTYDIIDTPVVNANGASSKLEILRDVTERRRLEKAVQESEERFRTIFENAPDGILVVDPETMALYTGNTSICQMLGYSPEELKNLSVRDLHRDEDLSRAMEEFQKQLRRETTITSEFPFKRKDGSIFYADVSSTPVEIAGKKHLMSTIRDVSERREMFQRLEEQNETIKKLNEGLLARIVEKTEQIENISKLGERLTTSPDTSTGLEWILDSALDNLGMEVGAVFAIDRQGNLAVRRASRSRIEGLEIGDSYPLSGPYVEFEAVREGKSLSKSAEGDRRSLLKTPIAQCAPIFLGKEKYGIITFGSRKEQAPDPGNIALLGLYSELVSTVFETETLTVLPVKEEKKADLKRFELEAGASYLIKDTIEKAFEVFADNVFAGSEGLCITREFPEKIRKQYGLQKTPIVWLTDEKVPNETSVNSLQEVSIMIASFLQKARRSIVLLDGIEYMITQSGFDSFLRFLQINRSRFEANQSILIAPLLEVTLDARQIGLIEREMKPFTSNESH